MNRIDRLFETCRARKRAAFIPYVTAGFPDMETTEALIPRLEQAGADMIELGVPFSDPIADGPTIQKASTAAIEAGTTLRGILDMAARLRKKTQIPLILFSALNPLLSFGLKELAMACVRIGIDGLLVPDLPPEEAAGLIFECRRKSLSLIFLAAPTTPSARLKMIAKKSTGFIYFISTTGVTGARDSMDSSLFAHLKELRALTDKPVAVGFGISRPEHVARLKDQVDGVIVGSALVRCLEEEGSREARLQRAESFVKSLSSAL